MTREEKLALVAQYKNILNPKMPLKVLKPNEHNDWLNQRSDLFSSYISIGDKEKATKNIFSIYSGGCSTSRDCWVYNYSKALLSDNINKTFNFYNNQRKIYISEKVLGKKIEDIIDYNKMFIVWTDTFLRDLKNNIEYNIDKSKICDAMYRPF